MFDDEDIDLYLDEDIEPDNIQEYINNLLGDSEESQDVY